MTAIRQTPTVLRVASLLLSVCICLCSCNNSKDGRRNAWDINEDSTYIEEALPDTMDGKEVTHECAKLSYNLDDIILRLENVKSPSMLIRVRELYPQLMGDISKEAKSLSDEESDAIAGKVERINQLYFQVCRAYEVEAASVLQNLSRCAQELEQVHDSASMAQFMSYRYNTVTTLQSAHLCVDQHSPRIREIRQIARQLEGKVKEKMEKYNPHKP